MESVPTNIYLSGGGGEALGVHLGMLDVLLKERNPYIVKVYGTSAGSIAGALLAKNPTVDGIQEAIDLYLYLEIKNVFGRCARFRRKLNQIGFFLSSNSVQSFNSGKKYAEFLKSVFEDTTEFQVPFTAVGYDLNTKLPVFFDSWLMDNTASVEDAIFASTAQVPELPPLVRSETSNIVDGGIELVLPVVKESLRSFNVKENWAFVATKSGLPANRELKGLGDYIEESVDGLIAYNLKKSIEDLQDPNGIPSHIIFATDFPDMKNFLDFFNYKAELVDYGRRKMGEYLANPKMLKLSSK